jgi:hypothetical protein
MPCYVAWAPTPWNGRLGVFIASPHNYSRWTEAIALCWWAHWTVRCTPDMHCSLSGALPRQPTFGVCSSRPLPRLSSAHRTVRCYSPRAPIVGLSAQTARCPTRQVTVHYLVCHQCAGWLPTSWISLLFPWAYFVLEFWISMLLFMSSFEVLHPQYLSPILFASSEL